MSSLFERWRQRQRDLDRGVDADLVHDNRNRYRLAFGLIGFGFLLGLLNAKVHLPSRLRWIVLGIGMVSLTAGFLLALWAKEESAFLSKPDPDEAPRIFRQ
jgi:hypothetical protein